MKKKRPFLPVGLIVFLCVMIGYLWFEKRHEIIVSLSKHRVNTQFSKVDVFKRPALFLTYDEDLKYMDVSEDKQLKRGPILKKGHLQKHAFFVRPDNSGFYIILASEIVEFNKSMNLLRRIPLESFGFNSAKYELWPLGAISDETLWLRRSNRIGFNNKETGMDFISMEWEFGKDPNTCLIVPPLSELPLQWPFPGDPWGSLVSFLDAEKEHSGKKILLENWDEYKYGLGDFHDKWELLFSTKNLTHAKTDIMKIDKTTGAKRVIASGANALWGADGYCYFLRSATQLWRCKPNGTEIETVYKVALKPLYSDGFIADLQISDDRNYLAYRFHLMHLPINKGLVKILDKGIILFDLKNREYRELPATEWISSGIAWLSKQ